MGLNHKTIALLTAEGLGDGLLMMIMCHQFQKAGKDVTLFHPSAEVLQPLFPTSTLKATPKTENLANALHSFDCIIVQNDHSEQAYTMHRLRKTKKVPPTLFLFPTKSPLFEHGDLLFSPNEPIGKSIAMATAKLLEKKTPSFENGLLYKKKEEAHTLPSHIVIHPTSRDPKRNWRQAQFYTLAKHLQKRGYTISFVMEKKERKDWLFVLQEEMRLPTFTNLTELTAYMREADLFIGNDSGLGHLATFLHLPTLTISGNQKRVKIWQPHGPLRQVVTPFFPLPNFKGIKCTIRDHFWPYFVPIHKVERNFDQLIKNVLQISL